MSNADPCLDCGRPFTNHGANRCEGCVAAWIERARAHDHLDEAILATENARDHLHGLPADTPGARQEDELGAVLSRLDGIRRTLRTLNEDAR